MVDDAPCRPRGVILALAPLPLKLTSTRPSPFGPRRKSILDTAGPPEADGSALVGSMVAAVVADCVGGPLLTVSTRLLPSTRER